MGSRGGRQARWLRWALAFALGACVALPARSEGPAVVSLDGSRPVISLDGLARFWIEPGREKPVEQIEKDSGTLPWTTLAPGDRWRLDGRTLWIEFETVRRVPGPWYVEIDMPGLKAVESFHRGADGGWVREVSGSPVAVDRWPVPGRVPAFELPDTGDAPVRRWLRVEHDRVDISASLRIYGERAFRDSREWRQFLLGAYFCLSIFIALVSALNAAVFRDRQFAVYTVYVAVLTVFNLSFLGVGAQHLRNPWIDWNGWVSYASPGAASAAGLWFVLSVTEPARHSRGLAAWTKALLAAILVAVALDVWLRRRETLDATMYLVLAAAATTVLLVIRAGTRGRDRDIGWIALGFLPVVLATMLPVGRVLGWIDGGDLARYGVAVASMLEIPILFHALSLRGNRRREAQARAQALGDTDALTGLADERNLLRRLTAVLRRGSGARRIGALIGVEVANAPALAARHGANAVDRALIVTAAQLRREAGDADTAARLSGAAFAVLLEGPVAPNEALARAQGIVAQGLRASPALPPDARLKLNVVIAMLPGSDPDAATTLQWVIRELEAMPADARKSIKSLNF